MIFKFFLRGILVCAICAGKLVVAASFTIAILGMEDDTRYQTRRIEHSYPDQPSGRPIDAARLAIDESDPEMQAVGHKLKIKSFTATNAADLPNTIAQLKASKVQYVLLDLPDAEIKSVMANAPAALGPAVFFNIGSGADELRGTECHASLLHTYPSESMRADALAQYLAARSWNQAMVLSGPRPKDTQLLEAFMRSSKRYGIKVNKSVQFKLSTDPRERNLSNVRLLTNDRSYDVVAVMDSEGEFARSLPYNTQWPRPVIGSNGLTALAWHPQWSLNGGPQLSRRFMKAAHRPMTGQDWAAWAAVKALVSVLSEQPKASVGEQLKALRSGDVYLDGFKGPRLSFRAWDGQLRQPIFLSHADGVVTTAPFEGVMHPKEVLDTLGVDEQESTCRKRPL
ncbi:MAG: hypothetical protein RL302_1921 [Pseudomonadota bacterium]